jgi:hypothetical protein
MRRAILLLVVVAALAAVGAATGSPTGRTTRHPIPTAGISLVTPSSWRAVDSRAILSSKGVQAMLKENPQLAAIINQVAGANSPVKFLSFDPKVTDHFATNVNVVVTSVPANITFPVLAAAIASQLKSLPGLASPITSSTVTLPIGRAVKESFRLTIVSSGKKLTVQTLQYILLRNAQSIVVTFSTTPNQSARRAATFTAIAASIHAP